MKSTIKLLTITTIQFMFLPMLTQILQKFSTQQEVSLSLSPIDDSSMTRSLGKQVLPDVDMEKFKGDDMNTHDTLTLKEPPELLRMASPKLKDPPELLFQLSPNDQDRSLQI